MPPKAPCLRSRQKELKQPIHTTTAPLQSASARSARHSAPVKHRPVVRCAHLITEVQRRPCPHRQRAVHVHLIDPQHAVDFAGAMVNKLPAPRAPTAGSSTRRVARRTPRWARRSASWGRPPLSASLRPYSRVEGGGHATASYLRQQRLDDCRHSERGQAHHAARGLLRQAISASGIGEGSWRGSRSGPR